MLISTTIANHDVQTMMLLFRYRPLLPSWRYRPKKLHRLSRQHWSEEVPDWAKKKINFRIPREQEVKESEANFPHEAIAEECSYVIPDISEKLEYNRGYSATAEVV